MLPVILDLVNDFPSGVKHISSSLRPIRQSFMTMGFYYLVKVLTNLPKFVWHNAIDMFAQRTSILMTNVRGPPVAYHMAGAKSIKVTTFMPNM